ncbi:uncharacterized protein [Diadema antillarum]|uniref:uncharacterized protein n=1 Tax=Diadema antillarum TaxID=105358 RepID=UPI003A8A48A5
MAQPRRSELEISHMGIRVRLLFDDCSPSRPGSSGRRKCWFLLNPDVCRRITDVEHCIRETFSLGKSTHIELYVDDFVMPPFEKSEIIRENDLIRVKLVSEVPYHERTVEHNLNEQRCDALSNRGKKKKKAKRQTEELCHAGTELNNSDIGHEVSRAKSKDLMKANSKKTKRKTESTSEETEKAGTSPLCKGMLRNTAETSHSPTKPVTDHPLLEQKSETFSAEKRKNKKKEQNESTFSEGKIGKPGRASQTETNSKKLSKQGSSKRNKLPQPVGCDSTREGPAAKQTEVNGKSSTSRSDFSDSDSSSESSSSEEEEVAKKRQLKRKRATPGSDLRTSSKPLRGPHNPRGKNATVLSSLKDKSPSSCSPVSTSKEGDREPLKNKSRNVRKPKSVPNSETLCSESELGGPKVIPSPMVAAAKVKTSASKSSKGHLRFSSDSEAESDPEAQVSSAMARDEQTPMAGEIPVNGEIQNGSASSVNESHRSDVTQARPQNCTFEEATTTLPTTETQLTQTSARAEGAPEARDYSSFPPLLGAPRPGDTIAYKILELSSIYTPEVSAFKEGEVITFDHATSTIQLRLCPHSAVLEPRRDGGKFEMELVNGTDEAPSVVAPCREVSVTLSSLIDPKLIT